MKLRLEKPVFFVTSRSLMPCAVSFFPTLWRPKLKRHRHLRIWSAGCSTGEEPYTLCMMLLEELGGQLQGWTFEILATDLNERSVAHAEQALYGGYSTRNLPEYFRQKYFVSCGDNLQISA